MFSTRLGLVFAITTPVKLPRHFFSVFLFKEVSIEIKRQQLFRALRLLFIFSLVAVGVWFLWQRQMRVFSRVGYLNGTLLNIYARISGTLVLEPLQPGQFLHQGQEIGRIANERNPQLETDRQNLETRLAVAQRQRQVLLQKRRSRQQLIAELSYYQREQYRLEVQFAQEALQRVLAELREAQEALTLARLEADRYNRLVHQGAVSRQRADEAIYKARQAEQVVKNKQAELRRYQTNLEAFRKGLQLDSARTFSFPQIRVIDLQIEVVNIEGQIAEVEVTIEQLKREIANIKQQLALQRLVRIRSPIAGVVWSVIHKSGALGIPISAGDPIAKVLDCDDVWATALVAERENARLRVGQPATVRLLDGSDRRLRGWVRAIRGGSGKVVVGETVAVPPPDLVRNELAVDIALEELPAELGAQRFCGVGQSVEVIFDTRS
ncbi:HlyD family secretion protein [Thermosynechococcus sp.]|uniref:HlyD family secretion protein n=1 Tax=Thermosynechococcus sp. TaxID=2814275 RepID=UPI00391CE022